MYFIGLGLKRFAAAHPKEIDNKEKYRAAIYRFNSLCPPKTTLNHLEEVLRFRSAVLLFFFFSNTGFGVPIRARISSASEIFC